LKPERGLYRAITVVLLDGPDFQELPAVARWVFVALKIGTGPCGIQVEYPEALWAKLAARTGYPEIEVEAALTVLERNGWVKRERNVVWVVGQLQHEPSLSPRNPNHRPTILSHVQGLPRLAIVGEFIRASREYFDEPDELAKAYPKTPIPIPDGMGDGMGDQRQGKGRETRKSEEVTTTSADAAQNLTPHNQRSCMALVVERLYFGNRPREDVIATNASILRNLAKTEGFDRMARIIEGLALRRDRGELYNVGPHDVVSLKWLNAKGMDLNQLAVSEDAYYRSDASPRTGRGGTAGLGDVAREVVGRIGA
jgi:hypothetical protein